MTSRTHRNAISLLTKSGELAVATPAVMSHRLARMAMAGPVLSARDKKEFTGMVTEKQLAFTQSWIAMMIEMARANQTLALSLATAFWTLPLGRSATGWNRRLHDMALGVTAKGLAPVHRRAKANAGRLASTKLH